MATEVEAAGQLGPGARWSIMIVSLIVTSTSFLFINGVAFLIPALEAERQTPLTEASLLSSMPSWGMVVTLVGWGYVLDRAGERMVLAAGSALTAVAAYAAASVHSLVWVGVFLFLGGMAAAGCNSAGGRLVSGWFAPQQRGLAMGIRQTAQPLGIALGALAIPELAEHSPHAGLMFPPSRARRQRCSALSPSSTHRANPCRRPPPRNWQVPIADPGCCGESTRCPRC
jgi:MFS family permease